MFALLKNDRLPLLFPLALVVLGTAIGMPFSLGPRVAGERIAGAIATLILAPLAIGWIRRLPDGWVGRLLVGLSAVALVHALWQFSASGADPLKGPLGEFLNRLLAPLVGRVTLTDPVELTNARYMWGMASVCLVGLIALLGAFVAGLGFGWRIAAAALGGFELLLLVGTGQRGALVAFALAAAVMTAWWWWRHAWLAIAVGAGALLLLATTGLLAKGLDLSSTVGRVTYWADVTRLMAEYPLTGTGMGLDTANRVNVAYELNPDPERVFYVHNTFVQTYQEQGPLATVGMLLLPVLALISAAMTRRSASSALTRPRMGLIVTGLGLLVALEVHGLTDQVIPTISGTLLLSLAAAAIYACASPAVIRRVSGWTRLTAGAIAGITLIALISFAALPGGRALALLNLAGLQLNQALLSDTGTTDRTRLAAAEATLAQAAALAADHPAVQRNIARARIARFDTAGAVEALGRATASSERLDAFDALQVAHLYRDLGYVNEAYTWVTRAYAGWGRQPPAAVIQPYREATVKDDFRLRDLAAQGEAALRARNFGEALDRFQQALALAPDNTYLRDRVGDAERGVARFGRTPASP